MPRFALAASLLRAPLLLLALGCSSEPEVRAPRARVELATIERIVIATGTIEPDKEVEIRPRIAGIVETIHVEEGDLVEAGQPLIEIERELLAARVREAQAALLEADVTHRYARITRERTAELHRSGASSDEALDGVNSQHERAAAARARAQARLDTLSTQLGYATVRSPSPARVLKVHTEEGNAVSPVTAVTGGTLLISLSGTDALHLEGLVDENEVARVRVGQLARIRTEAFGDRVFAGEVSEIAPLGLRIQNVTYFEVEIEITDSDAAMLRPRMSGDASLVTETVADALVVPETALRYRGNTIQVMAVNGDGEAVPVEVTLGIVDGNRVQILSGLAAGDEVELK